MFLISVNKTFSAFRALWIAHRISAIPSLSISSNCRQFNSSGRNCIFESKLQFQPTADASSALGRWNRNSSQFAVPFLSPKPYLAILAEGTEPLR
jgi:hypothetical protein